MKKITCLALIVGLLTVSSCRKSEVTITHTITVDLNANETYKTSVAQAGDADDVMQITAQAQHSSVCSATPNVSTGVLEFQYTPALNYIGTDEVQISNVEGQHHGNGGPQHGGGGGCHSRHHDTTIYIYKINITGSNK